MIKGLTVTAWAIAKPLLLVVLLPLAVGMAIRRASVPLASRMQPLVKKMTGIAPIVMGVLCVVVYGKGMLGVAGELAVTAQVIFFLIVTPLPYWFGFGLQAEQKIVLSAGMATRNIGAALAPLFSVAGIDERATIMVVLGFFIMVIFALLSVKWFGHHAA
jgi:BASS family bile acid:Na+ symporter